MGQCTKPLLKTLYTVFNEQKSEMDRPVCQDSPGARTWPLHAKCRIEENFLQLLVHPTPCVACIKTVISKIQRPNKPQRNYFESLLIGSYKNCNYHFQRNDFFTRIILSGVR